MSVYWTATRAGRAEVVVDEVLPGVAIDIAHGDQEVALVLASILDTFAYGINARLFIAFITITYASTAHILDDWNQESLQQPLQRLWPSHNIDSLIDWLIVIFWSFFLLQSTYALSYSFSLALEISVPFALALSSPPRQVLRCVFAAPFAFRFLQISFFFIASDASIFFFSPTRNPVCSAGRVRARAARGGRRRATAQLAIGERGVGRANAIAIVLPARVAPRALVPSRRPRLGRRTRARGRARPWRSPSRLLRRWPTATVKVTRRRARAAPRAQLRLTVTMRRSNANAQ